MTDLARPLFHFQPANNWMNDPNGPVWLKDGLHMFYQYNPKGATWGNMTWGHAVSPDLMHWKRLPEALFPDMPYDKDGVFSGCCTVLSGLPHILYTGVQPQVQCLAIGNEDASAFTKYEGNPVLPKPPVEGMEDFRDPFLWREGDVYKLIVGGGYKQKGGVAFLYQTTDLKHYTFLGELCRGTDPANDVWECPNFLPLEDKGKSVNAVLLVSLIGEGAVYAIMGKYDGKTLAPRKPYPFDLGNSFYAPNTVRLPGDRHVLFGWMKETVPGRESAGWQGMLTLPREVYQGGDGSVKVRPLPDLVKLRKKKLLSLKNQTVHAGENPFKELHGRHLEILLRFEAGANTLALETFKSPRGEEKVSITYNGADEALFADCAQAGGAKEPCGGYVLGGGITRMHVFLDGSAIEVYLNERETLTTRAYPTREDADGLRLFSTGGIRLLEAGVWELEEAIRP